MNWKDQYKFGITCEFKPLWEEFENLAPGSKKSKMIRYLIYNFLYNNGNRTRNTFEDANSEDWEYVEGALKVYNKFIKEKIKLRDEYKINNRIFWVEEYDYKIKDNIKTKEEINKLKENGYNKLSRQYNPNTNPSNWTEPIDQDLDKIILKRMLTTSEQEGNAKVSSQKESDLYYERINKVRHEQIEVYLSQPNKYYVKCKVKNQAFDYYEKAYKDFGKDIRKYRATKDASYRPSIEDLVNLNDKLRSELIQNNLIDFDLSNKFSKLDRDFVREEGWKMNWQVIPKGIDGCLILNSFYLKDKRNLNKIKRDAARIFKHYTILEFKENKSPKIIGPRDFTIQNADYEKASEIYED
jgi:hypothetical protein